jgi:hypothetical protein
VSLPFQEIHGTSVGGRPDLSIDTA